jgi:hypothetical protein
MSRKDPPSPEKPAITRNCSSWNSEMSPCYGVEHSGAAAMHLHTVTSFDFSATVSSPILIGSPVVCSSDAPSLSARL